MSEPWPDATPQPMRPVEPPARARTATVAMPPEAVIGAPPAVPGTVEDPTQLPGPRDIPGGGRLSGIDDPTGAGVCLLQGGL